MQRDLHDALALRGTDLGNARNHEGAIAGASGRHGWWRNEPSQHRFDTHLPSPMNNL